MSLFIEVMTTVQKKEDAIAIAQMVLEKRLAACVQIRSISSMYRWKGHIEATEELSCVMKSRQDLFPELRAQILSSHPYEVPEVLARQISDGNDAYLIWLDSELQPI